MSEFFKKIFKKHLPLKDILEIGYHPEYSISLAHLEPNSHLIVETTKICEAKKIAQVHINDWKKSLDQQFDLICYYEKDVMKPVAPESLQKAHLFLNEAKKFTREINTIFPDINTIKYSDTEIDLLLSKASAKKVSTFLFQLVQKGQVTEKQYQRFLEKHHLEAPLVESATKTDDLFSIADRCLKKHLKKNGKFICISSSTISKYEHAQFFENIITNPDYEYSEEVFEDSLILQIEKLN